MFAISIALEVTACKYLYTMSQEPTQIRKIIIETYADYSEALAALDEQIEVATMLSENIAELADAIQTYEVINNITSEEVT